MLQKSIKRIGKANTGGAFVLCAIQFLFSTGLASLLIGASCVPPAAATGAPQGAMVHQGSAEDASDILKQMTNTYRRATTLSFTAAISSTRGSESRFRRISLSLKKPNHLAITVSGDKKVGAIRCDGRRVDVFSPEGKRVTSYLDPKSMEDVLNDIYWHLPELATFPLRGLLLGEDPFAELPKNLDTPFVSASGRQDGRSFQQITLTIPASYVTQAFLLDVDQDTHLLNRMQIRAPHLVLDAQGKRIPASGEDATTLSFHDWQVNQPIPDSVFAAAPGTSVPAPGR